MAIHLFLTESHALLFCTVCEIKFLHSLNSDISESANYDIKCKTSHNSCLNSQIQIAFVINIAFLFVLYYSIFNLHFLQFVNISLWLICIHCSLWVSDCLLFYIYSFSKQSLTYPYGNVQSYHRLLAPKYAASWLLMNIFTEYIWKRLNQTQAQWCRKLA